MRSAKLFSPPLSFLISLGIWILLGPITKSETTQKQMLSGLCKDDAIPWDFFCDAGRGSGVWTKIQVPSCWETQGFGIFNYGNRDRDPNQPVVTGKYRRSFAIPREWAGKRIFIVFDGSLTDTEVLVNGASAGDKHQGGFYQFRYEITKLVHIGSDNRLEVTVRDESSDPSVNRAERRGDYWNFGGIFRPVYLEAVPQEFLRGHAIDARADGSFSVDVTLSGLTTAHRVEAQILSLDSKPVGAPFSAPVTPGQTSVRLSTKIIGPSLWSAETPNLYQVVLRLKNGQNVLHEIQGRFGFRTFEVRERDGLYLNGRRIFLKGCDRHSFWPDSGRTTSPEISKLDIALMKQMNMNAVRMSHYPPDEHFLELCDSEGLYVLDELPGWQKRYDTGIGQKLVPELVKRDVNHPSILFWDNGNEGGWNTALDGEFAKYDPQNRRVLHPWEKSGGVNTKHYPDWKTIQKLDHDGMLWMPTEFRHGLDDGGAGAGLNDYFELMRRSRTCVGGFIWAFLDEAVKRADQGGILDTKGNNAPDGIVGPYREKEGSFFSIKEIWSPVFLSPPKLDASFAGKLAVENRYSFANLNQCKFQWELRKFPLPQESQIGFEVSARGISPSPNIEPGNTGAIQLALPKDWANSDALALEVKDWRGEEIWTAVWPISNASKTATQAAFRSKQQTTQAKVFETPGTLSLSCEGISVAINKQTGRLEEVRREGKAFSLKNGPRLVAGEAVLQKISASMQGSNAVIECSYSGAMKSVRWTLLPDGTLKLEYAYELSGAYPYLGVSFDYPESQVKSLKWLGNGPYRVYKNRLKGGTLNVWENGYNDTITGRSWGYPEFKGYFSNVRWAKILTTEGPVTAIIPEAGTYFRMLTPTYARDAGKAVASFPPGDISFLQGVSPIGSKFCPPELEGPEGEPNSVSGAYSGTILFQFGEQK